jgi:Protein of unknown function (DUF1501)
MQDPNVTKTMACDEFHRLRFSRRETLRAGVLTLTGLGLPCLLQARPIGRKAGPNGFGRAKSCILIFLWGGPSQLDTWDLKPDAPEAIRGSFKSISTNVPGISISEHFPMLAQQAHRLSIVRSMNHSDPAHLSTAHRLLTGHLAPTPNSDAAGPSPQDWPHLGALVSKLRPTPGALPSAVNMPWTVMHPAAPGGRAPGQDAGWLGKSYDPFHIDGDPNDAGFQVEGLDLPEGVSSRRLADRRALLKHVGDLAGSELRSWDSYQQKALDAMVSAEARGAFLIDREDPKVRDRYGRHIHGQCLLLARRLVEAGVAFVEVALNGWDTHNNNEKRVKELADQLDPALSALIGDLKQRGMLDDTLIVWMGDFGRTPTIGKQGGRDHYPKAWTTALAGGGIKTGQAVGRTDPQGGTVETGMVSAVDFMATICKALGINYEKNLYAGNRPMRVVDKGEKVVKELF